MRAYSKSAALAVAGAMLGALGMIAWAEPPDGGPRDARPPRGDHGPPGPEGRRPPPPPLETTLDADRDGEISASEIDNASSVLKKLDKNGDGKLTPEEYRPPRPPMGPDFEERGRGNRDENGPPPRREGRRRGPPDRDSGDRPRDRDSDRQPDGDCDRRGPPDDRGPEARRGERGPGRDRGPNGPPRDPQAFADHVLQFDKNDDGKVTESELPEQMHQLLRRADTNDDDALDRAELERMAARGGGRSGRRPGPPHDEGERGDRPRPPSND